MLSPLTGLPPALTTLEKTVAGGVRLTDELHRPAGGTSPARYALGRTPAGRYTSSAAALAPAPDGASPATTPGPPSGRPSLPPAFGPARGRPRTERDLRPSRIPRSSRFRVRGYERGGYTAVTRRQRAFPGASPRPVRKYGRTLLPCHELGRARPRRPLPRRRRTAVTRPGAARRLQAVAVIRAAASAPGLESGHSP